MSVFAQHNNPKVPAIKNEPMVSRARCCVPSDTY